MSTYVIGDLHGCFKTFLALLEKLEFDGAVDRLWLVGDLANGGPDSLGLMRWVMAHDERIVCVLGNHDLYLLARQWGVIEKKKRDTLKRLLRAPDAATLMEWLRQQPLIHREGNVLMVHAGLTPQWDVAQAEQLAREIEAHLRGERAASFLSAYFASPKRKWRRRLSGQARLIHALRVMTMLRTCRPSGNPCFDFSGPPEEAPPRCEPWYQLRPANDPTFYFGHWAALGFRSLPGAYGMDSGCVWGHQLTAVRLEDGRVSQVESQE